MMPAPMTTTAASSRMVHRQGLDHGAVEAPVGRDEAAGVDELFARVVDRLAVRVGAAPSGGVDERFRGAGVPAHAGAPGLQVSVVCTNGDEGALEPGAPVADLLPRAHRV